MIYFLKRYFKYKYIKTPSLNIYTKFMSNEKKKCQNFRIKCFFNLKNI